MLYENAAGTYIMHCACIFIQYTGIIIIQHTTTLYKVEFSNCCNVQTYSRIFSARDLWMAPI